MRLFHENQSQSGSASRSSLLHWVGIKTGIKALEKSTPWHYPFSDRSVEMSNKKGL
jgi:hypothetical protein